MAKTPSFATLVRRLVDEEIDFIATKIIERKDSRNGRRRQFISCYGSSLAICDHVRKDLQVLERQRAQVLPIELHALLLKWTRSILDKPTKPGLSDRLYALLTKHPNQSPENLG